MDYCIVEKEAFKVIGRRCTTPDGGGTWGVSKNDGSYKQMEEMETGKPFLGLCFGWGEDGSNDYMVGIEHAEDDVPGLESYTYPKNSWLVVKDEGKISDNILGNLWDGIYKKFLPESGRKQSGLPTIEVYADWNNEANYCKMEIWIPTEK